MSPPSYDLKMENHSNSSVETSSNEPSGNTFESEGLLDGGTEFKTEMEVSVAFRDSFDERNTSPGVLKSEDLNHRTESDDSVGYEESYELKDSEENDELQTLPVPEAFRSFDLDKTEKSITLFYENGDAKPFDESRDIMSFDASALGFRTKFAAARKDPENQNFRISKNPREMMLERIEAFFYNHGMKLAVGILYISANLLVAGWGAYQFSERGGWTTTDNILRVTLPIARAGGRLVTLNCAVLLITACKYLWTVFRNKVVPMIPIGFPIDEVMPKYHSYVALTVIFSGIILHTLPQIVNYASQAISMKSHSGMKLWTFGQGFATKQLLITGTLLTIIFSSFFFTTRKSFRKTAAGFRWFWAFHMFGIASVYFLLILHGTYKGYPIFLFFNLLPLGLYLFDIAMRHKDIITTKVVSWKVYDDDGQQITELVLERPENFVYTPGQYAELKFLSISSREWHPFTIASAPTEDKVIFYIKNAGRWTGALMEYASAFDLSKAHREIMIRGPHGAPAMNYFEYKHIIVIGSGVGVTPLLSIWKYLIDKATTSVAPYSYTLRSSEIFLQSMNFYNDESNLKRFKRNSSVTFLANDFPQMSNKNIDFNGSFGEMSEAARGRMRNKSIVLARFLESITVSLSLFGLSVLGLTLSVLLELAGCFVAANVMAATLLLLSLFVHGCIFTIWVYSIGWSRFMTFFQCWLELDIILLNSVALYFSIKGCLLAVNEKDSVWDTIWSLASFGALIVFHALRIFHIFYMNLKGPPSSEKNEDDDNKEKKKGASGMISSILTTNSNQDEFLSVKGILVNRKYSNMKFAARCLLPPILQNGLSDVFSMQFYGTREIPKTVKREEEEKQITEHSLVGKMMGSLAVGMGIGSTAYYRNDNQQDLFCPGRPDWHHIFLEAISKAHSSNVVGESVGVFFCGSPAIAKDLRAEARKVTAQHQFAMNHMNGRRCRCKLIVHSENF